MSEKGRLLMRASLPAMCWALVALPAAGQVGEEDGGGDGAGGGKAEVEGVVLQPKRTDKPDATSVSVILGATDDGGRQVVIALPVKAGAREAAETAQVGVKEAERTYVAQEERVQEWAKRELADTYRCSEVGMIELSELSSRLELTCPEDVNGGEAIVLQVKSVGNFDETWEASLVYPTGDDRLVFPDGGRYETQRIAVGDKVGGDERVTSARFTTYPADSGKILGVRVERPDRVEDGATLWVKVR